MLKCSKKASFSHLSLKGFSLIELVIGILITMVIGGAMMQGTSYYRDKMLSINVKEKAYGDLKNFTNYWKSKIAASEWQIDEDVNWRDGGQIELFTSDNPEGSDESVTGNLYYRASKVIKYDNYEYYYYSLDTKVSWNILNDRDSLIFSVDQIVFN
jgi:type II secretory pathway pseudopilin PulG